MYCPFLYLPTCLVLFVVYRTITMIMCRYCVCVLFDKRLEGKVVVWFFHSGHQDIYIRMYLAMSLFFLSPVHVQETKLVGVPIIEHA